MIRSLAWDSTHFGIAVGSLDGHNLTDLDLMRSLTEARINGIALLYLYTNSDRELPAGLLHEFGGRCVDCRLTYCLPMLQSNHRAELSLERMRIRHWSSATATARLRSLAVLAGKYSRFRVDPRIPSERCQALFETWIEQSVRHVMADETLVAEASDGLEQPTGFVTVSHAGLIGRIGLIAVAEEASGRGIGTALVHRALELMRRLNAEEAAVVTQEQNSPARRLYERCGFQIRSREAVFHFWLGAASGEGPRPTVESGAGKGGADWKKCRIGRALTGADLWRPEV